MDKKFGIALIALVGIGIFALPSTIALFAGQHSFYNIDARGNQVPCVKCHGDVKAELGSNNNGPASPGPHANFKCEYCHRTEAGFSAGDDAYVKIWYNNVTAVATPLTQSQIALVTTIQNFERGNFPKSIKYVLGINVDNWAGSVFDVNGSAWSDVIVYRNRAGSYSGVLSPNGDTTGVGATYNYSLVEEKALSTSQTAINAGGFDPRLVTFAGTSEATAFAGAREVTPGTRYHAASLVSCMECHGGEQYRGIAGYEIKTPKPYNHAAFLSGTDTCTDCHYGTATNNFETNLEAGGFNLTKFANDTGEVEAHTAFVKNPAGSILRQPNKGYGAANIACVACHTHVAVDINFQKKYKVLLNATALGTGSWDVGGYGAEGVVNITVFGNTEGDVWATSNKSYTWTPGGSQLYINGSQANPVGRLTSESNDSKAALESTP